MTELRQSTASTVKMGPFKDAADGVTNLPLLTIQKADVLLAKNGGAYAAADADQGAADVGAPYDANGDYDVDFNATDTATLGGFRCSIEKAGALEVWRDFTVITQQVWDSKYGADKLQVDISEVGGVSVSGVDDFKADVSALATAASIAALADFNPSNDVLENGKTYDEIFRIDHASASGLLTRTGNVLVFKGDNGSTTRMTATVDANNNRVLVITSGA